MPRFQLNAIVVEILQMNNIREHEKGQAIGVGA